MHLLASGIKIHFIEKGPKYLDGRQPNGFAEQRHQEKIVFKARRRQCLHDLHDEPRTRPLPTPGFVVVRFSLFIIGAAIPWPQMASSCSIVPVPAGRRKRGAWRPLDGGLES